MPDGITKMICRSRRRARCDGCACLAEQLWAGTAKDLVARGRDEERRLLRNAFAGKPLDKRRQDGGFWTTPSGAGSSPSGSVRALRVQRDRMAGAEFPQL
jgi:hypothetical protein